MKHAGSALIVVLLVVLFLFGCTTMNVAPLQTSNRPAVEDWEKVAIYDERSEIGESFEEIAVLEVESAPTREEMIRSCQRKAASMGANGILVEEAARHGQAAWCRRGEVPVDVPHPTWHGRVVAVLVAPR